VLLGFAQQEGKRRGQEGKRRGGHTICSVLVAREGADEEAAGRRRPIRRADRERERERESARREKE
jgi:hypothetical protein